MKTEISILGCGWLGKPLALHLSKNNYQIKGSTTTLSKKFELEKAGIKTFVFSLKDDLPHKFFETNYLIIAIPPQEVNDFKPLISNINNSKIKGVVIVSSTSVYDTNNEIKSENSPTNQSLPAKIENLFLNELKKPLTIIRFGGLFGPNRNPVRFLKYIDQIKNPKGYINFIHLDDCIHIITEIIQHKKFGEIYNAVTPDHPKREKFYNYLADISNQPRKQINTESNQWKKISSQKLMNELNYNFKHEEIFKALKNLN